MTPEPPRSTYVRCRSNLVKLLSQRSSILTHIHCYGLAHAGVSETVALVEEDLSHCSFPKMEFVNVNCFSIEGIPKELFNQISFPLLDAPEKVESISRLSEVIDGYISRRKCHRVVIVLHEVHALFSFTTQFLVSFLDLARTSAMKGSVCFLSTSHLPWEYLEQDGIAHATSPLQFYLEAPSKGDCVDVISDSGVPRPFVVKCIDELYNFSSNPSKLQTIVIAAWNAFKDTEHNTPAGNKRLLSFLGEQVHADWAPYRDSVEVSARSQSDLRTKTANGSLLELTDSAKVLVVASFVASDHPPAVDKRYLIKGHGKQRRRVNEKKQSHPGPFSLQRLLFIRLALLRLYNMEDTCEGYDPAVLVHMLLSLRLLSRTSAEGNLDDPRFKCAVSYSTATELARQLDIDLDVHLDHS